MAALLICPVVNDDEYSAEVFSSPVEIQGLRSPLSQCMVKQDILHDPTFFLASLSKQWRPRVACVGCETQLQGVVFAKERIIGGVPIGVLYSDLSFGSLLFGNLTDHEKTFRIALEALLSIPGIRGIRLRVLRGGSELAGIRKLLACRRLDVHVSRLKDHARLSLPDTSEQLLHRFGSTTRRNFRYYRRRFEAGGHVYLDNLSLEELRSGASYLEQKCTRPSEGGSIDRVLKMVATADRPLAAGLKHRNGEWLSVIGGVYRDRAGVMLLQLNNDRNYPRDSLSVVLRGYLLESLIRQGMRELILWAGTAPPLSRYVTYIPTLQIHLDSREYMWRMARRLVSKTGPWLPRRLQPDARWIAPFR